ncbi:MAG TPA: DUF937 domain-containing protein [Aquabacterium sp.]|nr:DUF937 domain-containing protein [Aquabacterium sp.]HRH29351.1 DUF937 domain-containing protein [Aquabacterium sp.]
MQINDILTQMGGLQSVARELGVSEADVAKGAEALVPAILGGVKKQVQSQGVGSEGLGGLLSQLGGGLLENVLSPQPTDVGQGNNVLGQIFGSKEVSRAVADNAAAQSGLDPALLKKMLPMLAMLVTGYMARQGGGSAGGSGDGAGGLVGALTGALGGLFGNAAPAAASGTPAASGGLMSMLDLNGDGNPLDDILNMAGKAMR